MFPHLYSPLDISNVVDEFDIILNDDGNHVLPDIFWPLFFNGVTLSVNSKRVPL